LKAEKSLTVPELIFPHEIFMSGALKPSLLTNWFDYFETRKDCGAWCLFTGQIREEQQEENALSGIEYSAYPLMAIPLIQQFIAENQFHEDVKCFGVMHSVGLVRPGQISLFACVAGAHRKPLLEAQTQWIEFLKFGFPVWKRDVFQNGLSKWKI
jgi:molybdopterin synthase catalytic subunit